MVDNSIQDRNVTFNIDTGADVTVLPYTTFNNLYESKPPDLQKAVKLPLQSKDKVEMGDVYVVRHLPTTLLGRLLSCKLGLVARLDSVTIETFKQTYPKLCRCLGEVQQLYTINLKSGAQPPITKDTKKDSIAIN